MTPMADASAIGHLTQSLEQLLRAGITNQGDFAGTIIDLRSPREIGTPAAGQIRLSLWLYRVEKFDDLDNRLPLQRAGRLVPAPLPLLCHYLLTPLSSDELTRHRLLGHAMQLLQDQAALGAEFMRAGLLGADDSPISLHLERQSMEDVARLWSAMSHPHQLSVSYLAQFVGIESARSRLAAGPVLDREARHAAIGEVA
jgi:hypothetical protein